MKKLLTALLSLILLLTLCLPALADDNGCRLTVQGSATVSVKADYATLSIGVQTDDTTVALSQNANAAAMNAVLAALHAMGIDKDDITTSSFNVYSYDDSSLLTKKSTKYHVTNMLTVTVRDLTLIGTVIDTATAAGANVLGGLSFESTARNEAYQKAMTRAVEDAKTKAQVLAAAAGKTLGELLSIETNGNYSYAGATNYYAMDAKEASTTIVSGDTLVSASVTLVYSFQ